MNVPGSRRLRRLTTGAGAATLVAVLALAAVGCTGANGAGANGSAIATTKVDLPKSYLFSPAAITVKAGSTVTWTNDDNFTHSVQLDGAQPLVMKPGQSVTHTFDAPGTFHYICSFHPQNMQGEVIVTGG